MPSTTVAAGLLVIGLLVGAGIGAIAISPMRMGTTTVTSTVGGTTVTSTVAATATQTFASTATGSALAQCGCTITIGDITDLTGSQAVYGVQNKVAIDMAIANINTWLKSLGDTVQFKVEHLDDQTDPAVALTQLQTLNSQGVQVTIGPYFSGAAENMLSYAQSNHIVMISPQATSPTFDTAAHQYLFLIAPTDDLGAAGLAGAATQLGAKAAVIIYRNDAWGTPYSTGVNASFYKDGGVATTLIPYTPITSGSYDFTAQLTQAQTTYNSYVAKYGASHVVFITPGFDESATLYEQAATSYPGLLASTWLNTDTDTGFTTTAGTYALKTIVLSDVYEPTVSPKYNSFISTMQSTIGAFPFPYTTTSYDATWLGALTILAVGANNGAAVNSALPSIAQNYYGVSGWTDLNQYNDRFNTDYGIWQVLTNSTNPSGTPVWVQIGTYSASGSLTYTQQPALPKP